MAPSASFLRTPSGNDLVDQQQQQQDLPPSGGSRKGNMFERRRRRKDKVHDSSNDSPEQHAPKVGSNAALSREKRNKARKSKIDEEDVDPYDSDPGESYREHCREARGFSTKSCLVVPKFMAKSKEEQSVLTAPPSPLQSEMGDLGQTPASLPTKLTRVRYSLRSSITDGAEPQPSGPTVMERRDLRPNNVRMNVSHWSDEGGRPYMEDRYVGPEQI